MDSTRDLSTKGTDVAPDPSPFADLGAWLLSVSQSLLPLAGWLLVALAIATRYGTYPGLPSALAALVPLTLVVLLARNGGFRKLRTWLFTTLAVCWVLAYLPVTSSLSGSDAIVPQTFAVVTVSLAIVCLALPTARWLHPLLGASMVIGAVGAVRARPTPHIDVWYILQRAATDLPHGHNMYLQCLHTTTDPNTQCVYPYWPATTLLEWPFKELFGDVRYAHVAAIAVAAYAVYRLADPRFAAPLASLIFVYPHFQYGILQAWTEPLVIAALACTVLAVEREKSFWAIIAFGIAIATKQHLLILVPLALKWRKFGVRQTGLSLVAAAVVCLPWIVSAPGAMWSDTIKFHVTLTPRPDSLSLYSLGLAHGWTPPFFLVALVTAGALALAWWRLPDDTEGFLLGSAFVLFCFTIVNKASFFNHYTVVLALLVLYLAVRSKNSVDDSTLEAAAPHETVAMEH